MDGLEVMISNIHWKHIYLIYLCYNWYIFLLKNKNILNININLKTQIYNIFIYKYTSNNIFNVYSLWNCTFLTYVLSIIMYYLAVNGLPLKK